MSEAYSDALAITIIAVGALIVISFFFIGVTRVLEWVARRGVNELEVSAPAEAEKRKRALIAAAAITRYLKAERRGTPGRSRESTAAKLESSEQDEEK